MPRAPMVSFLSDFGRSDTFVGQCHAVLASLAPGIAIIDLTHEVAPQDVRTAAVLLARAVPHLPVCVHLAVVDPGVGTHRAAIAVSAARGDVLVGPDNGLLAPAVRALGGVTSAVHLPTPDDPEASATFHGRDVFAPAAARIAAGQAPDGLGVPCSQWQDLSLPQPQRGEGWVQGEVLMTDRFGNAQLNVTRADAHQCGLTPGVRVEITWRGRNELVRMVRTFGDLTTGELGVLIDSDDHLAVVVAGGTAAGREALTAGTAIWLAPADG